MKITSNTCHKYLDWSRQNENGDKPTKSAAWSVVYEYLSERGLKDFHPKGHYTGMEIVILFLEKWEGRIKDLEEAMEELMGWQNGPPLITYEKGWTAAYNRCCELLNTEQGAQECDASGAK